MENKKERLFNAKEFMDIIDLRCGLIFLESRDLLKTIENQESFINMIYIMNDLIDIDDGVFAILDDDLTSKIYRLINKYRFEIKDSHPEVFNLINDMIIKLNSINLKKEEEKEIIRERYLENQEKRRNLSFTNYGIFLEALGVDSFVLDYIEGEELEENLPDELIIGSLVYLINAMPGLFEIEEIKARTTELINKIGITEEKNTLPRKIEKIKQRVLKR